MLQCEFLDICILSEDHQDSSEKNWILRKLKNRQHLYDVHPYSCGHEMSLEANNHVCINTFFYKLKCLSTSFIDRFCGLKYTL